MKNEGALAGVFSGMRNLSVRCVLPAGKLGPGCRLPTPGESCRRPCPRIRAAIGLHGGANGPSPSYRTRWEERALPIVRDEFRPAIPRRVARQQSPLPLHRHGQDKPLVASGQSKYHRTVDSVLTVCLTKRGNRTHTITNFLPTSMPAQHSNTAGIIYASCSRRSRCLSTLQVVPRAEAQSRVRSTSARAGSSTGLTPPLRRTSLRPNTASIHPNRRHRTPHFHVLRVAGPAMCGLCAFICGQYCF